MAIRRSTLIVALGLAIAGCGSGGSAPTTRSSAPSPAATLVAVDSSPSAEPTFETTPEPTSESTAEPTPVAAIPPKPTGVTFEAVPDGTEWTEDSKTTMTVTWEGPRTEGVEIRVYGITECLSGKTASGDLKDGPCLVEHTALPASSMRLIAKAPSSDGTVSWTWHSWENIGGSLMYGPDETYYESVVLAAYNEAGHSIFAIAATSEFCSDCTY
jgi:hypothetical protein